MMPFKLKIPLRVSAQFLPGILNMAAKFHSQSDFVIYEKFSMGIQAWILTQPVLSLTMTKDNP